MAEHPDTDAQQLRTPDPQRAQGRRADKPPEKLPRACQLLQPNRARTTRLMQSLTSDPTMTTMTSCAIGLVSISDRASSGVYQDKGIPALEDWLRAALLTRSACEPRLIPDERAGSSDADRAGRRRGAATWC